MTHFHADLRARLLRLEAAAPDAAPAATAAPRTHGKRTVAAVGLSLAILASVAVVGAPALSRGTYETRLRDFGVPAGAEIVAWQADADGNFLTVMYRDSSGQVVTLGGIERLHTPPPTP